MAATNEEEILKIIYTQAYILRNIRKEIMGDFEQVYNHEEKYLNDTLEEIY